MVNGGRLPLLLITSKILLDLLLSLLALAFLNCRKDIFDCAVLEVSWKLATVIGR